MVLILFLIFLFPLIIYCFFIGAINRRESPMRISGHWDTLFLFLGLSGFFLAVLPGLLSTLYSKTIGELPFRSGDADWTIYETTWARWSIGFIIYYAAVGLGVLVVAFARRKKSIIYNIDVNSLEFILAQIAQRRGWHIGRVGKHLVIDRYSSSGADDGMAHGVDVILYMDAAPGLHHATLTWTTDDPTLRAELQKEMESQWGHARVGENGLGEWMLWIGVGLFEIFWFFSCLLARALLF